MLSNSVKLLIFDFIYIFIITGLNLELLNPEGVHFRLNPFTPTIVTFCEHTF